MSAPSKPQPALPNAKELICAAARDVVRLVRDGRIEEARRRHAEGYWAELNKGLMVDGPSMFFYVQAHERQEGVVAGSTYAKLDLAMSDYLPR